MMVKVVLRSMLKSAHGRLDDMVLRRTPKGEVTVIKLADMSNVKWSRAQILHRRRCKAAIAYAKAAMADPAIRLYYEETARQQNKRPFHVAVSDYFKGEDRLPRVK
jgi:hypothetical protein